MLIDKAIKTIEEYEFNCPAEVQDAIDDVLSYCKGDACLNIATFAKTLYFEQHVAVYSLKEDGVIWIGTAKSLAESIYAYAPVRRIDTATMTFQTFHGGNQQSLGTMYVAID